MKKRVYIGLAAILMLLLLTGACGKRRSSARSATGPPTPELAQRQANAPQSTNNVFTAEDYTLMSMPYEERLACLEDKLKKLVYEMHGIVIEESISAA